MVGRNRDGAPFVLFFGERGGLNVGRLLLGIEVEDKLLHGGVKGQK